MKNLIIYLFSFNFIANIFFLERISANDTLPGKKELYIAYDIAKPIVYLMNNNISLQEISIGLNSDKKYNFSVDMGMGNILFEKNNYNLQISGLYFKAGLNKKVIQDNLDFLSYGFRLAGSKYINDYTEIIISDGLFNNLPVEIEKQKLLSFWGEVLLKLDLSIIRNISFGWALRVKFPLYFQKDDYFKPYYVPGYGKTTGSAMIGLNYYIYYKIPFRN